MGRLRSAALERAPRGGVLHATHAYREGKVMLLQRQARARGLQQGAQPKGYGEVDEAGV